MTVVSSSNTITFAGDGVQTLFDFNFKIFKEEDLAAVVRDSCGIERELVAGSDFKLVSETGNDSGGRAMYPVSGSPLQPGDSITFYREIAYSQELELVDNDPFSAGLLNEAFDRGVMRDQQLQEQVARALKYDISTPAEDQLMPQEFMRNIIEARDDSATARAGAESALSKSETAQRAAEYAKLGAETAQAAAEYAKSEAEAIAWDGIEHLRSRTPVLSGPESANEGTTVEVSIVDYVEDSLANYEINVSGFGSAKLVGSVIKWTLGSVDVDTAHSLKVVKRRRGEIYSETADYRLLVKNVLISDGPTMAFTNDYKGWPGAAIDAEVIQPPAFSVGAVNEKQIVSGKMEVDVTSGQKTVLDGTTASFLNVLEEIIAGDLLITDQGNVFVKSVTRSGSDVVNLLPSSGLLAYYDMAAATTALVPDVSGHGRDMALHGEAPTFGVRENGNRYIKGSGDDHTSNFGSYGFMSAGAGVMTAAGCSYGFWIKRDGSIAGTQYFGGITQNGSVYGYLSRNTTNFAWVTDSRHELIDITPDIWEHHLFVRDSTSVKQYINGALATTISGLTALANVTENEVMSLFSVGSYIAYYRSGSSFDDYVFYNRPLTDSEALQVYNATLPKYSAEISLPAVPTKVFKNPLQGETINVGAGTTATRLETNQLVTEGDSLFLDGVEGVAGATSGIVGGYLEKPYTSILGSPIASGHVSGYVPENAFNGDPAVRWAGLSTAADLAVNGSWIGWKFNEPTSLEEYTLTPLADPRNLGATINLRASNDGVNWTTVQTDTAIFAEHSYHVESIAKYTYWAVSNNTKLNYYMNVLELAFKKRGNFAVDITSFGLATPPKYASRKNENTFALGAGGVGEYIGPKINLALQSSSKRIALTAGMLTNPVGTLNSFTPAALIDDDVNVSAGFYTDSSAIGTTLHFDLGNAVNIAKFTIGCHNAPVCKWGVWYSDNNSDWVDTGLIIDVGARFTVDGNNFDVVIDKGAHRYWKWVKTNAAAAGGWHTEIAIFAVDATSITTSKLVLTSTGSIAAKLFVENGFYNNILCDDAIEAKVVSVSEESSTLNEDYTTNLETSSSASWPNSWWIDRINKLPDGAKITAIGVKASTAVTGGKLGIWKKNEDGTVTLMAMVVPINSGVGNYEPVDLATPFQCIAGIEYFVGFGESSVGKIHYHSVTDGAWRFDGSANIGDTFTVTLNPNAPDWSIAYEVSSVKTTVNLEIPLAKVPTKVAIPDRYSLTPSGYASELSDEKLKITADKIDLPDNANLKQLAMAVRSPEDMRFTDGKIYIQEKS